MQRAFSLVELSIVLVILGLLVGGILAGQSLIRAAELRSVSRDFQQISTAMAAFKDKYFALPGDMQNATSFWGIAAGTTGADSTCYTKETTNGTTCNGDGDGLIANTGRPQEGFRFWQHLASAGLIEGQFNGVSADGDWLHVDASEKNLKTARIGGFYMNMALGTSNGNGAWFDGYYGNAIQLGKYIGPTLSPSTPLLKPEEMFNIDTKMDDGRPAAGIVKVRIGTSCTDSTAITNKNAAYLLTTTWGACTPVVNTGF